MLQLSEPSISNKERILILLKEYESLRTESIARAHTVFQSYTVIAAIVAALLAFGTRGINLNEGAADANALVVIPLAIALIAVATYWTRHVQRHHVALGSHIADVEEKINGLAESPNLLSWETNLKRSRQKNPDDGA